MLTASTKLGRIETIDDLETVFEEFLAKLNASEPIKAIVTVKLREAVTWIGKNHTTPWGTI